MAEQELLKVVVQKARFNEPAASYVLSVQYAQFQATTAPSAVSTSPVFVEQPLYFPFQPSSQTLQCKAYAAGEGPPPELAAGTCTWSEEGGRVQRHTVVLKDEHGQEAGVCELLMHTLGCGVADALARTISSATWLSIKCLALPGDDFCGTMQITCFVGAQELDLPLQFEHGACHIWVPLRLLPPPPPPAPESNDLPGYRLAIRINVSAEEDRAATFPDLHLGEPKLMQLSLNGRLWLMEVCLFSKSTEQLHVIEQISTAPLPDGSLLVVTPIQGQEGSNDVLELLLAEAPMKGGIIYFGSNPFMTGWREAEGLTISMLEFQFLRGLVTRARCQAVASDDGIVDPTRELFFKLQPTVNEEEKQEQGLIQDMSISLRCVTHRPLSTTHSVASLAESESGAAAASAAEGETKQPDGGEGAESLQRATAHADDNRGAGGAFSEPAATMQQSTLQEEQRWLRSELQRKQQMMERLLVEFQRRGEALTHCGEEMHRLRLEKNDAVAALKASKSELRKSRNQSEQQLKAVVRNAFGRELSVDNADAHDLRQVIGALADRLAVVDEERLELKRAASEFKTTKAAHVSLQKQFKELQSAHLKQSVQLQKLHSAKAKIGKYQETIVTQEKVIARLQAYLAHFTGQQSTAESASQTDVILEGPAAAAFMSLSAQQDSPPGSITSSQAVTLSSAELQAACAAKDHRIAALEKQLVEASRNASREISELKMQLFDMELKLVMAGVPANEASNGYQPRSPTASDLARETDEFNVRDYLELPAIVPSLPVHQQPQQLSARSDRSGRATRRTFPSSSFDEDRPTQQLDDEHLPLSGRSIDMSPRSIRLVQSARRTTPPGSRGEEKSRTPPDGDIFSLNLPAKEAWEVGGAPADPLTNRSKLSRDSRRPSSTEELPPEFGLSSVATPTSGGPE